jgi:hypothetical protein
LAVDSELFGVVFLLANIVDRLSNARFLTGRKGLLQDGQFFNFGLQLLQMLCPFSHIDIGGFMYSMQTGHSSSFLMSLSKSFGVFSILFACINSNFIPVID